MIVYEFYLRDKKGERDFIGVLTERRSDPKRVTQESIMNWVKSLFGDSLDEENIIFVQKTIE